MNYEFVFDSYAWAEFFNGTPKGEKVLHLLKTARVATSVMALAELSEKFTREGRNGEKLFLFMQTHSVVIPLVSNIAIPAGELKLELRKYSRNVSLADAIHFQTAKHVGATFVTGDPDFKDVSNILFL